MSKRMPGLKRNPRDFYPTPYEAVVPLLPHLRSNTSFSEPCAGDGALVDHLVKHGHVVYWQSDIEPKRKNIQTADALVITNPIAWADCVITNPPWNRKILHPMIKHFRNLSLTWLLFDADWMHTKQATPYLKYCKKIVSVGRVSWLQNGKKGFDNCCWYLFDKNETETVFIGPLDGN